MYGHGISLFEIVMMLRVSKSSKIEQSRAKSSYPKPKSWDFKVPYSEFFSLFDVIEEIFCSTCLFKSTFW